MMNKSVIPPHLRKALPKEAQTAYLDAYSAVMEDGEENIIKARSAGWNAVTSGWNCVDGEWIEKESPTPSDVHVDSPMDEKKPKKKPKKGELPEFISTNKAAVFKVDDSLGLVFGWAVISKIDGEPYFDTQGDHIPEDALMKATLEFSEFRIAGEMHDGEIRGTIPFMFPLTTDVAKSMNIETPMTGLIIAMRPRDPAILEKFKSGEYTGFSIGGRCLEDEEVE